MNVIKEKREKLGFTQTELAEQSGLSLRTIQRLEKANQPPKGHSLKVLSSVFEIEPVDLSNAYIEVQTSDEELAKELLIINLSTLCFFILPFGNVIIPLILWNKKKNIPRFDDPARRIINFQILWSIGMSLALSISPFLNLGLIFGLSPLLTILFIALLINFSLVLNTSKKIRKYTFDFFDFPLRII